MSVLFRLCAIPRKRICFVSLLAFKVMRCFLSHVHSVNMDASTCGDANMAAWKGLIEPVLEVKSCGC
jgi:hypothetical protein